MLILSLVTPYYSFTIWDTNEIILKYNLIYEQLFTPSPAPLKMRLWVI
jgi:hypothetical protein